MRRAADLWPQVVAWENLWRAARKARRGKRGKADVLRFELDLEQGLLRLQRELEDGSYAPGPYRTFTVSP